MEHEELQRAWSSQIDVELGLLVLDHFVMSECSEGRRLHECVEDLKQAERSPCSTVWKAGSFAYRCRDCQVTDSSAICIECFKAGPHAQHDYVMYRSSAGGCCDCGDPVSLRTEGFCSTHAQNGQTAEPLPQKAKSGFERLVSLLLAQLLHLIGQLKEGVSDAAGGAQLVLRTLQEICSVQALREVVCNEMLRSPPPKVKSGPDSDASNALETILRDFIRVPSLAEEETTLFLLMLYSHQFKESFSRALVHNYADWVLTNVEEGEQFKLLDLCLDRVMVQLINVESITLGLIKQEGILDCFVHVLSELIKRATDNESSSLNVNHPIIANRGYTRPLSDLRLVISHDEVSLWILRHRQNLLQAFLKILEALQYMKPMNRLTFRDMDEDTGWMDAIAMEVYITSVISQLVGGCYNLQAAADIDADLMAAVFPALLAFGQQTQAMLVDFYLRDSQSTAPTSVYGFSGLSMSLHIPLHRAFGMVLEKLARGASSAAEPEKQNARACLEKLAETRVGPGVDSIHDQALQIIEYPLRIMAWMAEIRARQWRHQGEDLARLERVYTSSYWHDQAFDMDVLVMQYCVVASGQDPDPLLSKMLERFKIAELLMLDQRLPGGGASAVLSRVLEFLRLLLLLVRERRHIGMSEMELLRYEVIQWLCYRDMTYSTLTNSLPAALSGHTRLEEVLRDVASYMVPKLQERGFYRLKPECWQEFDVLFSHFSKGEAQDALTRAADIGKVGKYWRLPPLGNAAPPFDALCNILHSRVLHTLFFLSLDQSLQLLEADVSSTLGESLAMVTLQLIATAAQDNRQGSRNLRHKRSFAFRHPSRHWPFVAWGCYDITVNVSKRTGLQGEGRSMADLIRKIQRTTKSERLRDCIEYVLESTRTGTHSLNNGKGEASGVEASHEASPPSPDAELRRQLKKQRQAAILAEFAAKQKAFLGEEAGPSTMGSSARDGETIHQEAGPSGRAQSSKECAFCLGDQDMNESSMAWITFIQQSNTAAIAHRQLQPVQSYGEAPALLADVGGSQGPGNMLCSVPAKSKSDSTLAANHAFTIGAHVACCGHQMHLDCFQRYETALRDSHNSGRLYEGFGLISLANGEFLCPICRRLANGLLPVTESALNDVKAPPPVLSHALSDVIDNLVVSANASDSANDGTKQEGSKSGCQLFVSECRAVRGLAKLEGGFSNVTLWQELWSVLAVNIVHCEIETRGCPQPAQPGKSTGDLESELMQLWGGSSAHWRSLMALSRLAVYATFLSARPMQSMEMVHKWGEDICGNHQSLDSALMLDTLKSASEATESVNEEASKGRRSLAAQDISADIISGLEEGSFLAKGPALCHDPFANLIIFFMTHVGVPSAFSAHAMLTAAYCTAAAQAYYAAEAVRKDASDALCLDVEFVSVMQAALVPFLRKAAMLVQVVSGRLTPFSGSEDSIGNLTSFEPLQQFLHLPDIPVVLQAMDSVLLANKRKGVGRLPHQLLLQGRAQLKLVDLPDVFQELLLAEMNRKCTHCGTVPREPALCLVCGTLVCCKSPCCAVAGNGECSRHASDCGLGIGLFLLLRSTQMLIMRGDRACMAPSIYLDTHGEEDVFLKRGRPLRLSRLRYDELERLWLTGGLDQNSQLLHSSHLGSETL